MIPLYGIVLTDILGLLIIFYLLIGICTICRIIIYRPMDFEFTAKELFWIFIYTPIYVFLALPAWVQFGLKNEREVIRKSIHILSFCYRMSEFSDAFVFRMIKKLQAAERAAIQMAQEREQQKRDL